MRSILGAAVIVLAACASHPAANQTAGTPKPPQIDAGKVADMEKTGYTIKNKNGERIFCEKEFNTGSHLQTTTYCLTEAQWIRFHQGTDQALDELTRRSLNIPSQNPQARASAGATGP